MFMDTAILLKSIRENLALTPDDGGAYILKQVLRDLETYPIRADSTETVSMHPERFAARIIAAYETMRHASAGEARSDFERLRCFINHIESFPFGDPRYTNSFRIHSPSYLVTKHLKKLQDICIKNSVKGERGWIDGCNPNNWERFFAQLEILLDIPIYSIFNAYTTFVGSVWRDGFYDHIAERLRHATTIDVPLGETIVTIDNALSCYVTFSPNAAVDVKTPRQWIGVTFCKGALETDAGFGGIYYTCCVDQQTALSLINDAIVAWPQTKVALLK